MYDLYAIISNTKELKRIKSFEYLGEAYNRVVLESLVYEEDVIVVDRDTRKICVKASNKSHMCVYPCKASRLSGLRDAINSIVTYGAKYTGKEITGFSIYENMGKNFIKFLFVDDSITLCTSRINTTKNRNDVNCRIMNLLKTLLPVTSGAGVKKIDCLNYEMFKYSFIDVFLNISEVGSVDILIS